jgi:Spx/MgsR family transcriptional regulator
MDQTTLYLVRHGTTEYNEEMRLQGRSDIPLNDLGKAQGKLLTEYFKDIPIDIGVTGPLSRARQTLDYILGDRKDQIPVIVEPGITEIYGGDAEGRRFSEINVFFPKLLDAMKNDPSHFTPPHGESGPEVYRRVTQAVMKILRAHPGKTIAMASHGFAIDTFLNYAEGHPEDQMISRILDNVAVSKFTYDPETDTLKTDYIGDSHHLSDEYRQNYDWEALSKPLPLFVYYPKCSTCRKAKAFLDGCGVAYQSRDIVGDRLKTSELLALMSRSDLPVRRFFNTSGKLYREMQLKDKVGSMTPEEAADCLSQNGMLVKRPILALPDRVILGFKEEAWREFLNL